MSDEDEPQALPSFRVVLVGDSGVGKSSIIHYLVKGSFESDQKTTIGAAFHTITRTLDGQRVQLQVWDTAGQEKFRSIGPVYYRNAAAAIGVYDVTQEEFSTGLDHWILTVKRSTSNALLFIVGNKSDLLGPDDPAPEVTGQSYADKYHAPFFATSAKTGLGIDKLFEAVFDEVWAARKPEMDGHVVTEAKPADQQEKGCCQ
jgi:small GTP-binding protein